ncbi:alpha/beta hydrolase [Bremerella sp. JC817]|uniref:serine aminopeptidase domain-containing protein n=1 Tax=Bremerella sp. JC817 TaxID=3231756 RepID=UPI003457ECD8
MFRIRHLYLWGWFALAIGCGPTADLSIPRLPPRPVVWLNNWQPAKVSATRSEADQYLQKGDALKGMGMYDAAKEQYLAASNADPEFAFPMYQLACNYELAGQHDDAVLAFREAMERGFDDFPTAVTDEELGRIRRRSDFQNDLQIIRTRYLVAARKHVGQPIAVRPETDKPPAGWPVILMLHGYGDTHLNYLDEAERWARQGFVAIVVPGSFPTHGDTFQWSLDSFETTHGDLQAIVHSQLLDGVVDLSKIYLLGFSQGALHAMLVTEAHADKYAGVVALSPGGNMIQQLGRPSLDTTKGAARIVFIHGEQEPHAPLVNIWARECGNAKWMFESQTHPGGHHFPDDWELRVPAIATFLLK